MGNPPTESQNISAFEWFQLAVVDEFRKANPGKPVDFPLVKRQCRRRWDRKMKDSDKIRFHQLEKLKIEEEEEEAAKAVPPKKPAAPTKKVKTDRTVLKKSGKRRKKRDPKAPKKALTPYFLFMGERRERMIAANPGFTFLQIGKEMGRLWKELPEEEKEVYRVRWQREQERYAEQKEKYDQEKEAE